MGNRKNSTDIDNRTRKEVHSRDGYRCVYCGRTDKPIELAHFISRAQGGLGIAKNLVSLCVDCHDDYDGDCRSVMRDFLSYYLKSIYPDWDESRLTYRKGAVQSEDKRI